MRIHRRVAIHITEKCNLRCEYCLQRRTARSLSPNAVEKVVSFAHFTGASLVELWGGEPFLEFDTIRAILEALPAHIIKSIPTNGLLLDKDRCEYLCNTPNVQLLVSLDPDNSLRGGNVARVVQNIKCLAEARRRTKSDLFIEVNSVVSTDEGANRYRALLEALSSVEIDVFNYAARSEYLEKIIDVSSAVRDLREGFAPKNGAIQGYLAACAGFGPIGGCFHCEGANSSFYVSTDLSVYPCYEFASQDMFKLGTLESGIDAAACLSFRDAVAHPVNEECAHCSVGHWCKGFCRYRHSLRSGSVFANDPRKCAVRRKHFQAAQGILSELAKLGIRRPLSPYLLGRYRSTEDPGMRKDSMNFARTAHGVIGYDTESQKYYRVGE